MGERPAAWTWFVEANLAETAERRTVDYSKLILSTIRCSQTLVGQNIIP